MTKYKSKSSLNKLSIFIVIVLIYFYVFGKVMSENIYYLPVSALIMSLWFLTIIIGAIDEFSREFDPHKFVFVLRCTSYLSKALRWVIVAVMIFCIPIFLDMILALFFLIGKYNSLSYIGDFDEVKAITSGEYIYYTSTIISAAVMSYLAYVSYQINKQQFLILKKLNDTDPNISVNGYKSIFHIRIKYEHLLRHLNDDFLDMSLSDSKTKLFNCIIAPNNGEILIDHMVINCDLHAFCSVQNKGVFINKLDEKPLFSNAELKFNKLNYSVDDDEEKKYAILSSDQITTYSIRAIRENVFVNLDQFHIGVEVGFETDHEIVFKGMFIESKNLYKELHEEILKILNKFTNPDWKISPMDYYEDCTYNSLKDILIHNGQKTIAFNVESKILLEKRVKKDAVFVKSLERTKYFDDLVDSRY